MLQRIATEVVPPSRHVVSYVAEVKVWEPCLDTALSAPKRPSPTGVVVWISDRRLIPSPVKRRKGVAAAVGP